MWCKKSGFARWRTRPRSSRETLIYSPAPITAVARTIEIALPRDPEIGKTLKLEFEYADERPVAGVSKQTRPDQRTVSFYRNVAVDDCRIQMR